MKFLFIFLSVPFILMSLSSYAEQASSKHPSSQVANEEASAKTPEEMFNLGIKYYFARAPRDYTQAFDWFSKSAKQGHEQAQYYLGVMYYFGEGVHINYKQAFYWYNKAAKQGLANAQYYLGWMYYLGQSVPINYKQAFYWYNRVAKQGLAEAQHNLGVMYYLGQGVPVNYKQAFYWYNKSAEQGYAEAQYNLGGMYYLGEGVPRNYKQAYKWLSLSAVKKPAFAESVDDFLDTLESKMTPAQISEAQKLVREFKPVIDVTYKDTSN